MRIGFIGLGNVGGKLANNLLENNFQITVLDSHFRYKFNAGCQRGNRGDEGVICKKCSLKREKKK